MKVHSRFNLFRYAIPLILALALVAGVTGVSQASSTPSISIEAVEADKSVTIAGINFPVDQEFTVKMGAYGTYGLGGIVVGKIEKSTEKITAKFDIPAELKGAKKIAIRLDSAKGYYAYNWFYNSTAPVKEESDVSGGYTGYPTLTITDVERNTAVDIKIKNLPAGQTFTVKMGEYMTMGLGGIEAGTFGSGEGGTVKKTFSIPAGLADKEKIAIRIDSPEGFYAYNWFWNNSTGAAAAGPETPAYTGIPTIAIDAVVRDGSVTLSGKNFPAGKTFAVTMGDYGTYAIGGIAAGNYTSGTGGDFSGQTFKIPVELAGSYRIAIRLATEDGFSAYNWFFNNTTE